MGKTTISWTNYSWNPWRGCHKVSQGCKNCYMFREQKRYGNDPNVVVRSKTTFNDPLKWKDPAMVFVNSWSDFFIEEADPWRNEAWEIIRQTPHLTYQILTKRVGNIPDRLPKDWGDGWPNVWLGVSIESQEYIYRAHALDQIPAKVRFVSAEPLLGKLNLRPYLSIMIFGKVFSRGIDWVIAGGESGPDCRPMKPEWVIDLAEQCKSSKAKLFMKQLGGYPDRREDIDQFPEDLRIQEFPVLESE